MRKITLLLALLFTFLAGMKAADVQYLVISLTDGTNAEMALADEPVITFSGDELKVAVGGVEKVTAAMSDVVDYHFTTTPTGIEQAKDGESSSRFALGHVYISNAMTAEVVRVYTADGRLVMSERVSTNGTADINLNGLDKGLYIIKSSKSSIKVINQ